MRAVGNHGSIMACVPPGARRASAHQGREKKPGSRDEAQNESIRERRETREIKRKQAGEPRGETERTTPARCPRREKDVSAVKEAGETPGKARGGSAAGETSGKARERRKESERGKPRDEGDKTKASGGRERKRIKATRRMLRDERDAAKASGKLQGEEHDEGQREAGRGKETEHGGAARRGTQNAGGARGPEREDQA